MTAPKLVPADAAVTVTATAPIRHLCPFVQEEDHGTVTIAWRCDTSTVELHSLAAFLDGFAAQEISHEDLVENIATVFAAADGIAFLSVTARFTTAGIAVEVHRDLSVDPLHP